MSDKKKTGQTVITVVLPDSTDLERQGSIIAKYEEGKTNLAHLMPFTYTTLADIARAIESAQTQLERLKRNPPQVETPAPQTPVEKATPANANHVKPKKKKKVSLDDIPDEEEAIVESDEVDWSEADTEEIELDDSEEPNLPPVQTPQSNKPNASVKIGDIVQLGEQAVDSDGDLVPFQEGRILEIDTETTPARAWVERLDGEADAWLKLTDLSTQ